MIRPRYTVTSDPRDLWPKKRQLLDVAVDSGTVLSQGSLEIVFVTGFSLLHSLSETNFKCCAVLCSIILSLPTKLDFLHRALLY